MGTCWGTREWLRSNCSRPLYQMPIPCRNTSCKPERWNANVLGSAPRRLTPPTASRKSHSSISGSSSNPAKRRTSPFQTSPGSSPNRSRFFSRRSWDAGTGTWMLAQPAHIYRCRQESMWPNPIKDTAYEKKEAPKLKHISRSELKRMTEIPMPDLMMELARRVFIFPRWPVWPTWIRGLSITVTSE